MSDQDLNSKVSATTVAKSGISDINPVTKLDAWFRINGVLAIDGILQRFNGKRLAFKFTGESILAIHSTNQGLLFIQTNLNLYSALVSDLVSNQVINDTTGNNVINDTTAGIVLIG